jgi:GntR family transcriptional regulator / MocR family aminotransferase
MPIDLHVSLVDRGHLTDEIYRQLRGAILEGRLAPGERLPSSRDLASRLSVSRTTISEVYDRLAAEGYTESHVGRGTFVVGTVRPVPRRARRRPGVLAPRAVWNSIPLAAISNRAFEFDLRTGVPDVRSFPFDAWRRLQAREWHRSAVGTAAYGEPAGDPGLRQVIAEHLAVARGVRATAEEVIVTNGTQQAVDIVGRVLISPGDVVAVEDPGYPPPRRLFASLGARVVGVPVDDEGLRVDAIPDRARVVFVSPSHQFPLGMAMSLRRRLALLAWAEERGGAIIEDDYDSEFRLGGRPIEPLQLLDTAGRVIYVGTFSKTMLPTLRLGFVVVPPSIRGAVEAAKFVTDWHSPLPTQRALAAFIRDGAFARHVRRMRAVYRQRHERLVQILRDEFADELRPIPTAAGVHVAALAIRRSVDEIADVIRHAADMGVAVQATASFAVGSEQRAGIVLGYGSIATEHMQEGLARLRASFERRP